MQALSGRICEFPPHTLSLVAPARGLGCLVLPPTPRVINIFARFEISFNIITRIGDPVFLPPCYSWADVTKPGGDRAAGPRQALEPRPHAPPRGVGVPGPRRVGPEGGQRLRPPRAPRRPPGHAGSASGLHPHADLHPHEPYFLFLKRPGSKGPMTTLRSPFLYLNISKHLAETFIFSLPQGEEVIRENGTNIPICQEQEGSELKGKWYHLTARATRGEREGPLRPSARPVCFFRPNFRNVAAEEMARGQSQVSILLRTNHPAAAPAQETLSLLN